MSIRTVDSLTYQRSLALRDLTDAALGPHAIQLLVSAAVGALREHWQCPVLVYRAPPVATIADNYDALGYPPEAAARDARYTRYVTADRLLRTQTSAMIPAALRMIAPAAMTTYCRCALGSHTGVTRSTDSTSASHISSTYGASPAVHSGAPNSRR